MWINELKGYAQGLFRFSFAFFSFSMLCLIFLFESFIMSNESHQALDGRGFYFSFTSTFPVLNEWHWIGSFHIK